MITANLFFFFFFTVIVCISTNRNLDISSDKFFYLNLFHFCVVILRRIYLCAGHCHHVFKGFLMAVLSSLNYINLGFDFRKESQHFSTESWDGERYFQFNIIRIISEFRIKKVRPLLSLPQRSKIKILNMEIAFKVSF